MTKMPTVLREWSMGIHVVGLFYFLSGLQKLYLRGATLLPLYEADR